MSTQKVFTDAMQPSIEYTVALIKELHEGQKDHSGHAYAYHPIRVAQNLRRIFPDATEDMIKAALLHDVIEDCGIDEAFLRHKGYSEDCIEMVKLVTKPENDEREYDQVIDDLIASRNVGAMKIKIADNAENLHPERVAELKMTKPEKALRLEARYRASIERLCSATGTDIGRVWDIIENAPSLDGHVYEIGM